MNKLIAKFQLTKALDETGAFEGYAAVFGNVDLGGDVIEPGAFKEFAHTQDGKVLVLLMHNSFELPIGTAEVAQDDTGLRFKGALVMDDPTARRAHAHMKAGTLTGMSIGYDILPGGAEVLQSGVRVLKALKLYEISPVIWGMNPKAQIDAVKAAAQIKTITDFERFLRDVGGFSHSQAKALAACGYKGLNSPRDVDDVTAALRRTAETLNSVSISSTD
jgi:HK97 family phage prohead protease